MKKYILNTLLWSVVLAGAFLIYNRVNMTPPIDDSLAYSEFISKVKNKLVDRVEMTGQSIRDHIVYKKSQTFVNIFKYKYVQ